MIVTQYAKLFPMEHFPFMELDLPQKQRNLQPLEKYCAQGMYKEITEHIL